MTDLKMYRVEENDLMYLKNENLGGRLKWIREKANEYNSPLFTVYRLAESISVAQSTISRIESGTQPRVDLLEKIAAQLGVSIAVFTDSYYEDGGKPFTICEKKDSNLQGSTKRTFSLLDTQYEATLSLSIKTHEGLDYKNIEETVFLSPIEHEEFADEVNALISKVRNRRKNWKTKQAAFEKLFSRKEE
ncbi:helix-turn-helix transcriptional regulator [Bacillus subtilis]|uniref:helix-turn-helix domain-containing protein n=1 Tax=Bacillus subtilis TaxID=1423 RepID=UPI0021556EBE|nr:helix-turn-helix transcriptional regulator [Bacillus subtilis]MED3627252.1 helix-turn-helix transcriptional regulator [Bacillus subtilis]UVB75549.1 helix-turn-helix transcriptional regulator [Bacillus subtilis]